MLPESHFKHACNPRPLAGLWLHWQRQSLASQTDTGAALTASRPLDLAVGSKQVGQPQAHSGAITSSSCHTQMVARGPELDTYDLKTRNHAHAEHYWETMPVGPAVFQRC